ncbi:hypothetical protein [Bifidobacterium magnum]|uniref:Uncharacterized protein n=1 Tax=Bifidobacterium magnum TaxID=1692 RepID=A0A087BB82_9BIFI|nr:hypothetical protein [Bifidobacterium magnum]KFI68282.1 hypothetical protein BMAGN_0234 [Bifidobacterium magnum]
MNTEEVMSMVTDLMPSWGIVAVIAVVVAVFAIKHYVDEYRKKK